MNKTLKISVLIPSRNRLELMKTTIETVRRQNYDNWEIIVSDNASDEDYESYIKSLDDDRIHYSRSHEFLSVTENWNRCLDAATGDYVIMLGDDDGLAPHYMTRMLELIKEFGNPDYIYHSAWHYIYPDAILTNPESRLIDVTPNSPWFADFDKPDILPKDKAENAARKALQMKSTYGFNMQYFLYATSFIKKLKQYGPLYQGPFPDFYAAQMTLLLGERSVIVPEPLVFIGISPKSYGFYFYNDKEDQGTDFLNSLSENKDVPETIMNTLLPGSNMNTSWLMSVSIVREKLKQQYPNLKLGIGRYRLLQIRNALQCDRAQKTSDHINTLWSQLNLQEKTIARILQIFLCCCRILPDSLNIALLRKIKLLPPERHIQENTETTGYNSLLTAFEAIKLDSPAPIQ